VKRGVPALDPDGPFDQGNRLTGVAALECKHAE
jgi:hypothetical protein